MTTMSKVDIIKDTVRYYCNHRRGIDPNSHDCVYFSPTMKARCAIGRFSISEDLDNFEGQVEDFVEEYQGSPFDEFLDPKVRGHDIEFWQDLQSLHDTPSCWQVNKPGRAGKALSEAGEIKYAKLLEKYGPEA